MKKLLILAMLMAAVVTCAYAAPDDAAFFLSRDTNDAVTSPYTLATDGENLYFAKGNTLYRWRLGMEEPEALGEGVVAYDTRWNFRNDDEKRAEATRYCLDALLYTDALYGLNTETGLLFKVDWADGKIVCTDALALDFSFMTYTDNDVEQRCELGGLVVEDGHLYVLARDYLYNEDSARFYAFDLTTGAGKRLDVAYPYLIAQGKQGQLLVMVYDENNSWDSEKQEMHPMQAYSMDVDTLEMSPLFTIAGNQVSSAAGVAYNAANDTHYFFQPNRVLSATAGGEPAIAAYLPMSYASGTPLAQAAVFAGGYYAICCTDGVFVRNLNPAYLPEFSLTVYGTSGYEGAHKKAQLAMGDIPVLFSETYFNNMQELSQAMVTGDENIDVMCLNLAYYDVEMLMEKGYCYDLSANAELSAYIDKLYPILSDAVTRSGQLLAVPTSIDMWGLLAEEKGWKETGLEDEKPTSYAELFAFITAWAEDYIEEYPAYQPMENESYKTSMFYVLMEQYSAYCQANGIDMTLDTPVFREALAAYEAMRPGDLELSIDWDAPDADAQYESIYNKTPLIQNGYSYVLPDFSDTALPMPLPLTKDTGIHLPLQVTVYIVNPRSKHLEAAVAYVAAYASNLDRRNIIAMCPDENTPVENKDYQKIIDSVNNELTMTEEALKTCEPADAERLQERIERLRDNLLHADALYRYSVSLEAIEAHRELMQYAFVAHPNILAGKNFEEFSTLYQRYLDGQISAEQFIREGSSKLRLMLLESK